MANKNIMKAKRAEKRRRRVRGKISGTAACPRLTVCKSLNNVFVQIVDDEKGATLCSAASNSKDVKAEIKDDMNKTQVAVLVGKAVANAAKENGIEKVVFDRNRFRYHGRVKAVADGVRKGGLKF